MGMTNYPFAATLTFDFGSVSSSSTCNYYFGSCNTSVVVSSSNSVRVVGETPIRTGNLRIVSRIKIVGNNYYLIIVIISNDIILPLIFIEICVTLGNGSRFYIA